MFSLFCWKSIFFFEAQYHKWRKLPWSRHAYLVYPFLLPWFVELWKHWGSIGAAGARWTGLKSSDLIAIRFLESRGPPGNGVNATVMVPGITHIVVLYTSVWVWKVLEDRCVDKWSRFVTLNYPSARPEWRGWKPLNWCDYHSNSLRSGVIVIHINIFKPKKLPELMWLSPQSASQL